MAGRGQRFTDAGHSLPKFLLEAHGKTLLQWSVDSLPLELATLTVFIMLREHEEEFQMEARIRRFYGAKTPLAFVFLDEVTRGQAETVMQASSQIVPNLPLLIFNIDTAFRSSTIKDNLLRRDIDGVLGCFRAQESRFSFAALNEDGFVTHVTEKEPISEHALTGLYHFSRASDFIKIATDAISKNLVTKGEFYVAPMYNALIAKGGNYVLDSASSHHILGTPTEYLKFAKNRSSNDLDDEIFS